MNIINVFVICNSPQRLSEQISLCKRINELDNRFNFILYLDKRMKHGENELNGLKYIYINDSPVFGKKTINKLLIGEFGKKIYNSTLYELIDIVYLMIFYKVAYFKIKKIMKQYPPSLLLINDDRSSGIVAVFQKLCRENNIKIIIPYYVYFSTEEELIYNRRGKIKMELSKNSPWISKYFVKKFSEIVGETRGTKYLFYSPAYLYSLYKLNVITSNPWYVGNGCSDILCLDNKYLFDKYKREKIPEEKLYIIGDIQYEKLYNSFINRSLIKKKYIKEYNLDIQKKIIIIALPQLVEHFSIKWDDQLKEISFLIEKIKELDINILISLHPRMKFERYSFVEEKFDVHIVDERLYDVLPIADVFIATFSSTVMWSVLCKINTIVVDFWDMNFTVFNFLESIDIVRDKKIYKESVMKSLIYKKNYKNDWEKLSRDVVFNDKIFFRYRDLFLYKTNKLYIFN